MPVTVAALATAVVVTPAVGDAIGERQSRKAEREYERLVAPAREALGRMRVDGLALCPVRDVVDGACLRGKGDVRAVTPMAEKALRDVGATEVVSRCKDSRSGAVTACTLTARLHGAEVHGLVFPVRLARKATGEVEVSLMATYLRS